MGEAAHAASSGIGVVDTTSLWAAAKLLGFSGPSDPLAAGDAEADRRYFLSLLHTVVLYDELRTDIYILFNEEAWYSEAVTETLHRLGQALTFTSMPSGNDSEVMLGILPIFAAAIRKAVMSRSPDPGAPGSLELASARAYVKRGRLADPLLLRWAENGTWLDSIGPEVGREIERLAKEPGIWGRGFGSFTDREKQEALVRSLSIAARSVRYAAHSSSITKSEKRPSAFCASPRRIEILRGYLARDALTSLETGADGFADLLPQLGLPTDGYDFGIVRDPLPLTALSRAIRGLPPQEALDRVIALRSTKGGEQLRKAWAARLWGSGPQALEGHARGTGPFQVMRNVWAQDIRQEVNVNGTTIMVAVQKQADGSWQAGDSSVAHEIGRALIEQLGRG